MKNRARVWARLGLLTALVALLVPASVVLAQDDRPEPGQVAALGAFFFVFLIFALAFYVYYALALQAIAQKTHTENPWLAWIPIANFILMLNIAKKPIWWIILCFVPLVNVVILIIIWMAIAEARGKPSWWGILMIVPVVGLIVPGYLAWAD
jgi:hypothetical protein